jgi:hypothetical protein
VVWFALTSGLVEGVGCASGSSAAEGGSRGGGCHTHSVGVAAAATHPTGEARRLVLFLHVHQPCCVLGLLHRIHSVEFCMFVVHCWSVGFGVLAIIPVTCECVRQASFHVHSKYPKNNCYSANITTFREI